MPTQDHHKPADADRTGLRVPSLYPNIRDRLSLARPGAFQIAEAMSLGPLLEEAQTASHSRRLTFAYGTVVVLLAKARAHEILGPLVTDPTRCSADSF